MHLLLSPTYWLMPIWDSCRILGNCRGIFLLARKHGFFQVVDQEKWKLHEKISQENAECLIFFFRKSEWWSDTLWNKAHQQSVHNAWRRVLPLLGSFATRSGSCKKQQKDSMCKKSRETRDFRRCQAPWFPKPTFSSSRVLGTYTRRLGSPWSHKLMSWCKSVRQIKPTRCSSSQMGILVASADPGVLQWRLKAWLPYDPDPGSFPTTRTLKLDLPKRPGNQWKGLAIFVDLSYTPTA